MTISSEGRRAPEAPPFSLAELKQAVPPHCFVRSTLKSFGYLAVNLSLVLVTFFVATFIDNLPSLARFLAWPVYWAVQGCLCTGIWVLAHECGHRSFSPSNLVNDCVGLVLHSVLLVPYHPWRISHGKHHAHTNHLDLDEVFVPREKHEVNADSLLWTTAPGRLVAITVMLLLGWPSYLIYNASGRKYERRVDHFLPNSPLFTSGQYWDVIVSDVLLFTAAGSLIYASFFFSFLTVVQFYGIPYLIVNFWLVLITFLQHTDRTLPHFDKAEWTWVKGAISGTIDRDYGVLNHVFHHIGDTHVCHHLFSQIPHYRAVEATKAIKKRLGEYYNYDDTPILSALWNSYHECRWVARDNPHSSSGALWFRRK